MFFCEVRAQLDPKGSASSLACSFTLVTFKNYDISAMGICDWSNLSYRVAHKLKEHWQILGVIIKAINLLLSILQCRIVCVNTAMRSKLTFRINNQRTFE